MKNFHFILLLMIVSCGTWVGNPKKKEEASPTSLAASSGDVYIQKVEGRSGQMITLQYSLKKQTSLALSSDFTSDTSKETAFEFSVVDADGKEVSYKRGNIEGVTADYTPAKDGDHYIVIKNNSSEGVEVEGAKTDGAASNDDIKLAKDRSEAVFKNIVLKSVVAFARTCVQNTTDGSSTTTSTAPSGQYYAQPFVFLGKVDDNKKVTDITTASITLKHGGKELSLKRLTDIDYDNFREYSSLSKDQHVAFTKNFYQGYFGGAGELYTVEYFNKGKKGGCESAPTFVLGTDVGSQTLDLTIVDGENGINETLKVSASTIPSSSFYMGDGTKVSDWTQCTYNKANGNPTAYNGDASACKQFSNTNPPYIKLDYKLPSEEGTVSKDSDPSRVLFYGYSMSKSWYEKVIPDYSALASGSKDTVTVPNCLFNGGLIAVPLSKNKATIPLGEFNTLKNDVINLGSRTGSYTSLIKFYQGNVDLSQTFDYAACLPNGSSSCPTYKTVKVTQESCIVKADSGISVTGISDRFIYPSDFSISGIVKE